MSQTEATLTAEPDTARPKRDPAHNVFPGLDGLRALAVLAVVTTHAAFWTGRYERGWGDSALARLDSGVAVFFVLSGFLLVRPWLQAAATGGPSPSVRTYTKRRVARIMPAYLIAVVASFLLLPDNRNVDIWDWVRHLTFTQTYRYGWTRAGLTQTWSLCTEVSFYVGLPLIGLLCVRMSRRTWRPRLLALAMVALMFVPLPWYIYTHRSTSAGLITSGYWLPGFIGWFAGGMLMAVVHTHLVTRCPSETSRWRVAEAIGRYPFTCWALAAAALFAALTPLAGPRSIQASTAGQSVTKQTLYLVMAMALAWPAVFGRSRATSVVLGNRVMRYAGDISYGVFLYHLIFVEASMALLDNPLFNGKVIQVLPLTLAMCVPVAALSFTFVERPIVDWVHRRTSAAARTSPSP